MMINQRDELLKIFPMALRNILNRMDWYHDGLEEIRVRAGQPLLFLYEGRKKYIHRSGNVFCDTFEQAWIISPEQVQEMMLYLCDYSQYAYAKQLRQGFLSLPGGIRVGVAGQWMGEEKSQWGMEYPMFFNIRIPSEKKGCARWAMPYLVQNNRVYHTLIMAPPGVGKTTFLRDLLREISMQSWCRGVSVIDERYELAGCCEGIPTNDLGIHTDVYSGYEKATGCMQAIRTMAPQVIAVDEIGGFMEGEALSCAMRCGISMIATMHGGSLKECQMLLGKKEAYSDLSFQRMIWVEKDTEGKRHFFLYDGEGKRLCVNP